MTDLTLDSPSEQILRGSSLTVGLPEPPKSYYRHGWQSWSLTAWTDPAVKLPMMKPTSFHVRQTDPLYARSPRPNGSWLGAAELADGSIAFLGALGLESHISLEGNQLHGLYESGAGEWFVARGPESQVFERYAELLSQRFGKIPPKKPPRVWCSWYSLYDRISENNLRDVFNALGDLPIDVIQIDDGWQLGPGDWEPNQKFPSGMGALAAEIKATGRRAGLWLAPLVVGKSSAIFRDHPDWLLKESDGTPVKAGFEWSTEIFALDSAHPQVLEWLKNLIAKVRGWGFNYLKLDFLSAGALPGKHFGDVPRESAYRGALQVIRSAAEDAYLLLSGTPILPALGLCDAMRIGADVADFWDSQFYSYLFYNQTSPSMKNGIRTSVNRIWLRSLVNMDPDVAFFADSKKLTDAQKRLFLDLTAVCGVKATSDLPQKWTREQREAVREWLESPPAQVEQLERTIFKVNGRLVDFAPAMPLPPTPKFFDAIAGEILGFLGNQIWALKVWHNIIRYTAK